MDQANSLVSLNYIAHVSSVSADKISSIGELLLKDLNEIGITRTHPFFDIEWVKKECPDLMSVGVKDIEDVISKDYPLISGSALFSPMWYLSRTACAPSHVQAPLIDFLKRGVFLGLSPHPLLGDTEPVDAAEQDIFWQNSTHYFRLQRDESMLHAKALAWLYGESANFEEALSAFTAYQEKDLPDGRWWFNPEIVLGEMTAILPDVEKFSAVLEKTIRRSC